MYVGECILEMGNFRVCNISMYAGECKPEMGKFRVCNILCIWVGANCKLEMGNFRFATCCVCVCLLPTSSLKWEI